MIMCPSCKTESEPQERGGVTYIDCPQCGPLKINGDGSAEPVEEIPVVPDRSLKDRPAVPATLPAGDIPQPGTPDKSWLEKTCDWIGEGL
jgi:hypothetical protein